jgi:vacuolar-type H+-ATPase subunit F/Vma7
MDFIVIGVATFIAGFILAGIFKIDVKVSKKEDYDKKLKELNELIASFSKEKVEYPKADLFPADINKDYGIPKELK